MLKVCCKSSKSQGLNDVGWADGVGSGDAGHFNRVVDNFDVALHDCVYYKVN